MFLFIISITSCSKNVISLDDVYGKYVYVECLYSNPLSSIKIESDNQNFKNISRFSIKEKSYQYYSTKETNPTIDIIGAEYIETAIKEDIISTPIDSIIKNVTTRYDVYNKKIYQGYSFLFSKNECYYMETRKIDNQRIVWKLVQIEKIS